MRYSSIQEIEELLEKFQQGEIEKEALNEIDENSLTPLTFILNFLNAENLKSIAAPYHEAIARANMKITELYTAHQNNGTPLTAEALQSVSFYQTQVSSANDHLVKLEQQKSKFQRVYFMLLELKKNGDYVVDINGDGIQTSPREPDESNTMSSQPRRPIKYALLTANPMLVETMRNRADYVEQKKVTDICLRVSDLKGLTTMHNLFSKSSPNLLRTHSQQPHGAISGANSQPASYPIGRKRSNTLNSSNEPTSISLTHTPYNSADDGTIESPPAAKRTQRSFSGLKYESTTSHDSNDNNDTQPSNRFTLSRSNSMC